MELRIFFRPDEIRTFLERNGFEVVKKTFERPSPAYHNEIVFVEYDADAVVVNNEVIEAEVLFRKFAENRLKNMVAPSNENLMIWIENEINNLKNNE